MSELQDFDLEHAESPSRRRRPHWPYAAAAALLVVALGLLGYFLWRGSPAEEAPPPTAEEPAAAEPAPASVEPPVVDLPELEESDPWLREVVGQLSSHPRLAEWLVNDDLVRRFVAAVDNVARGTSPRKVVEFLEPEPGFRALEREGRLVVDPRGYGRYDTLVEVIEGLDTRGTAELYRALRPLLQESYRGLGYPQGDFDEAFLGALRQLLETPVVPSEPELVAGVSAYRFADSRLEELNPAQKHFLRLGPANLARLKAKARALAAAIGFPAERLAVASG